MDCRYCWFYLQKTCDGATRACKSYRVDDSNEKRNVRDEQGSISNRSTRFGIITTNRSPE